MQNIKLNIPTKIYFGEGIVENTLESEKAILGNDVLIITTGGSLARLGHIDKLSEKLKGILPGEVSIYDKISQNPDISEVAEAVAVGKEKKVTSVIGFGGGSAMDAAKATAVGIGSDIPVEKFLYESIEPGPETLPIIAIPTTAGTGSELSKGAIISSREKGIKTGIRGMAVLPKLAIVDPVYTWSVPLNVTMETGFDVFAHAAESFCSANANMFSEMLSETAIKTAGDSLRRLKADLDDHEARGRISYASMIMGLNLLNIGNCLPHRMQYPVGSATGTSHAAGLIALYPSWIGNEYDVAPEKINDIFSWLGLKNVHSCEEARSEFEDFLKELGIYRTLSDLGVEEDDIDKLVSEVTGNLKSDRLSERDNILKDIYLESL